jgi:hypothetical protein
MTVQAAKLVNRDVYEVRYDGASGDGVAKVRMENPETEDVSTTETKNDGVFTVTVGTGYEGTASIEIADAGGHLIDSGTVTFGADAPDGSPDDPHPAHPIVLPTPEHPIANPDAPYVDHRDEAAPEVE